MENSHIFSYRAEHRFIETIYIFNFFVLHRVGETLLLDTGHIKYVGLVEILFEVGCLSVRDILFVEEVFVFLRHLQLCGRGEGERRGEVRKGLKERVNGSAVFQVSYHINIYVVQSSLGLFDGVQIEQCLSGVLDRKSVV